MPEQRLRCRARGNDATWDGVCVDLGVAVQGRSMHEVKLLLARAIALHVANAQQEQGSTPLLTGRASFVNRAKIAVQQLVYSITRFRPDNDHRSHFELPMPHAVDQ